MINDFHCACFCYLGYTDGPSVKNSGYSVCSERYGSLEWAQEMCNKDDNCKWLHDTYCDDRFWRFCSNDKIGDYTGMPHTTDSCSKLKGNPICNVKF